MRLDRVVLLAVAGVLLVVLGGPSAQVDDATGLAGHRWSVVSIDHDRVSGVSLQFSATGDFSANDSVNYHSGRYLMTPDGFIVTGLTSTAVGYAGHVPAVVLSVSAIGTFGEDGRVSATVSGNTLTVNTGDHTLVAERDNSDIVSPAPDH